jgi:hypothetical protein
MVKLIKEERVTAVANHHLPFSRREPAKTPPARYYSVGRSRRMEKKSMARGISRFWIIGRISSMLQPSRAGNIILKKI